ncbi:13281_t:CDS:1 [Ambispora gerdemannii]|uniref:13281_t:CDS:1 n=1 Tax=Ambispora gerdemannii TaxID=144530 RepID=A0A9N9C0K3_9GLOM|nr:13281_t:CDS:1 [Ambispora gerdemannii]
MKIVIIPLVGQNTSGCGYSYLFDSEWCLDLHGFLSRDEFAARINEINKHIREFPLLSERVQTYFTYAFFGLLVITTAIFLPSLALTPLGIAHISINVAYFVGKKVIGNIARSRAEKFNNAVNGLFAQYNQRENSTANWNLVWRSVITHYTIKMKASLDGKIKGKATPNYAEHAEIVLEINDALSDLTAKTVRVNLASEVVSHSPHQIAVSTSTAYN